MGTGGSKACCRVGGEGGRETASASSSSSGGTNRVFRSSCLGALSGSESPKTNFHHQKEPVSESDRVKKVEGKTTSHDEMPLPTRCVTSGASTSGAATTAAHQSPSRCLPGLSFQLRRGISLGSSTECPVSPTSLSMLNCDDNSGTIEPQQPPRNSCSPMIVNDSDGSGEAAESNARFSRALSVGRLRDRVLGRASTLCPSQQDIQVITNQTQELATSTSAIITTSTLASSVVPHNENETPRSREARHHDLLHHRSNFLERRRRIRSQVRALQRLGSRFENFSGHERSCILSGQHRTGQCTCRVNNRDSSSNDDANSSTSSVSRIVMLAEALFEVLDEIHQQSLVLSSQPSVSPIGPVPAPKEVVESLPVKLYKSQKLKIDEVVQCYICLVEYEEGDIIRGLPCNHEFHRTCIDKWLKEIHRVCPLCRGDVCGPNWMPAEN